MCLSLYQGSMALVAAVFHVSIMRKMVGVAAVLCTNHAGLNLLALRATGPGTSTASRSFPSWHVQPIRMNVALRNLGPRVRHMGIHTAWRVGGVRQHRFRPISLICGHLGVVVTFSLEVY